MVNWHIYIWDCLDFYFLKKMLFQGQLALGFANANISSPTAIPNVKASTVSGCGWDENRLRTNFCFGVVLCINTILLFFILVHHSIQSVAMAIHAIVRLAAWALRRFVPTSATAIGAVSMEWHVALRRKRWRSILLKVVANE